METKRLNLTVDAAAAELLEKMAGGRNKMGEWLSRMLLSMDSGTPVADIERMDRESIRLMIQGLLGRVVMLEGELMSVRTQLATLIADRS